MFRNHLKWIKIREGYQAKMLMFHSEQSLRFFFPSHWSFLFHMIMTTKPLLLTRVTISSNLNSPFSSKQGLSYIYHTVYRDGFSKKHKESKEKLSNCTSIKISRSQGANTLGIALKMLGWASIDWAALVSGKGSGFQGYLYSMRSYNTKLEWAKLELTQHNSHPTKLVLGMTPSIWTLSSITCPCHSAIKWLNHITLL